LLAYPAGTTTAVAGTQAFPSSITLSPSGSAAVLWFASPHLLEIVSGLPKTPVVRTVDASFLTGSSGDAPAALAVSDDGAWGAGAWPSGVWAFGPNGEVRSLLSGERGFALAFFPGGGNLLVATRTGVSSVADVGGSAAVSSLYTVPDALGGQTPAGLAVTADGQKIVLAEQRGGIVTIDANSAAATNYDCGCAPEGVFPMGASLFRITGLTGSVFRVFDTQAGSVFQVPLSSGGQDPAISAVPSGGRLAGGLVTGGVR
jgi:DNA-binding beta-propeller fold protein YncE